MVRGTWSTLVLVIICGTFYHLSVPLSTIVSLSCYSFDFSLFYHCPREGHLTCPGALDWGEPALGSRTPRYPFCPGVGLYVGPVAHCACLVLAFLVFFNWYFCLFKYFGCVWPGPTFLAFLRKFSCCSGEELGLVAISFAGLPQLVLSAPLRPQTSCSG